MLFKGPFTELEKYYAVPLIYQVYFNLVIQVCKDKVTYYDTKRTAKTCRVNVVADFQTTTIGYSHVCVCVCLHAHTCVCVCVNMITKKILI